MRWYLLEIIAKDSLLKVHAKPCKFKHDCQKHLWHLNNQFHGTRAHASLFPLQNGSELNSAPSPARPHVSLSKIGKWTLPNNRWSFAHCFCHMIIIWVIWMFQNMLKEDTFDPEHWWHWSCAFTSIAHCLHMKIVEITNSKCKASSSWTWNGWNDAEMMLKWCWNVLKFGSATQSHRFCRPSDFEISNASNSSVWRHNLKSLSFVSCASKNPSNSHHLLGRRNTASVLPCSTWHSSHSSNMFQHVLTCSNSHNTLQFWLCRRLRRLEGNTRHTGHAGHIWHLVSQSLGREKTTTFQWHHLWKCESCWTKKLH